ncbi:hypothetical protein DV515_00012352 [Chloebia gouldiae]|uniref:Uncharacterized protein n=1 Tax=Chloebia gouldiae TaxID=44316 RepID=A0A3L8S4F8_CHLGU|nr:hypothetical protein DV515_00012352 [Chloebia gouldiae]
MATLQDSRGWIPEQAGENLQEWEHCRIPEAGSQSRQLKTLRTPGWALQRAQEGPGAGSVLQEQPGEAVPVSPVPQQGTRGVAELHEVTAKS